MKEIVEYIAKTLADNPDSVEVLIENDGALEVIHILVDPSDMGKVIGKNGKIAQSIRTIVKSLAQKQNKRFAVKIEER